MISKTFGSGGIRTHAPEETGALNQRLRPLGHATLKRTMSVKIGLDKRFQFFLVGPAILTYINCLRPYHVESTGSRPITEVKQQRAQAVLGWVTAWEHWVP